MRNFNWRLFFKNIFSAIPLLALMVILGFLAGLDMSEWFWIILFLVIFVSVLGAFIALKMKPGKIKPEKMRHVVRPTTIVILTKIRIDGSDTIVSLQQYGSDDIRQAILPPGKYKLTEKLTYRVGFNYELFLCE